MPPRSCAVAVVALVTLSPVALIIPSSAVAHAAEGDGDPTTVNVVLAAPGPGRLSALSTRRIVDRSARLDRLAHLVPDQAQHDEVTEQLVAAGFTVGDQTSWSITATAPQSVVTDTFGELPDSSTSTSTAAQEALPDVPAGLSDAVAAVYPVTDTPAVHPLSTSTLNGADVRNADAPATITPSSGLASGGLTVATLQFSNWNQADLTSYASANGRPDPIASGQYRAVTVDRGPTGTSGASEVALDQESLLSVAPSARQTAYFAPNTGTGFTDAIAQVYDDVVGNSYAKAPDPHIVALSISWGNCEAGWGRNTISLMQTQLAALTAAGVTVFAASGDDGIYDCRPASSGPNITPTNQADVDFPASSPSVVAVGGTRLSAAASAPNLGANWAETAWTCASASGCHSSGGTGGGVSGSAYGHGTTSSQGDFPGFAKPSWQAGAVTDSPFAAGTNRMLPDIAADGDPATGFRIVVNGQSLQYGGTSLAAPLSAGQLANTLGDAGATRGYGDIHPALYQAYSATRGLAATDPYRVFRDVVSGSNGAAADAGADPSVTAGSGYDTVSGLGGVLWGALLPYLGLNYNPPTATTTPGSGPGSGSATAGARITATVHLQLRTAGHGGHRSPTVLARWSTTATGSTVASATIRITSRGKLVYAGTRSTGSTRLRARPGRPYVLSLLSYDSAGHVTKRSAHLTVRR